MSILTIIKAPDPILKTKAKAVDSVDDEVRKIMSDMLETLYHDEGAGLAAPQVGILKRILVIDLKNDDETSRPKGFYPLFMANPEIFEKSQEEVTAREGCMSIPEQRIEIRRPAAIKVKFLDYNNKKQELSAGGWLARAIQHEMDHLDGKLLIDYLSIIKKDIALRRLTKLKKMVFV